MTTESRLAKLAGTVSRQTERIAELQSERDTLRNRLAGGTGEDVAGLKGQLSAAVADLGRSEKRRKALQEQLDEWGAALDEVGAYLLKREIPVPIEGYRGAPTRLLGDIMTAVSQPATAHAEQGE